MSSSIADSRTALLGLSPAAAGAWCCVVSALGYSAANVCLRQLNVLECDPTWAICNKELVSVAVVGPWLAARAVRGLPSLPSGRTLAILALMGLATQLANAGVQWAMGVVGLAVTIPAISAFVLTGSASLGWFVLGEHVSLRSAAAIGLLVVSVVLLGLGAEAAALSVTGANAAPAVVATAVATACAAGIVYAVLSITIRHCVTGTTRLSAVVLVITGMGLVSLLPASILRLGVDELLRTPPEYFAWMTAAGAFNLVAFFALSKALQLTTVVYVNVANASQVALAALAGVLLFHESQSRWLPNPWVMAGVALTLAGIFLIGRPADHQLEMVDQHL